MNFYFLSLIFGFFISNMATASLGPDPDATRRFLEEEAQKDEKLKEKADLEKKVTSERVNRLVPGGATIAIVVNKDVITLQDIHDRSLLILLTSGMESTPQNIASVKEQVCKSLIDEKIQMQVAKEQKIMVSEQELKAAMEGIAKENNMNLDQLKQMFRSNGIALATLEHRLKAQIGWERTVREGLSGMVQISEADEAKALEEVKEKHKREQYELLEIFLRVDNPASERSVLNDINRIHDQLQKGANFRVLAQQFSQGASKGGYMGWLTKEQLDTPLVSALEGLKIGSFSRPIRISNGYKIIFLKDIKKPGASAFGQTQISFKRLAIPFDESMQESDVQRIQGHIQEIQASKNCHDLESKAKSWGYECESTSKTPLLNLPDELQKLIHITPVGKCFAPMKGDKSIIIVMICSKESPPVRLPSKEEVHEGLMQERLAKVGLREFNKIRTISFIEYKPHLGLEQ